MIRLYILCIVYIPPMSSIRIINGAGYGEKGESPDDYQINGLDNVNDLTKSVTIKDRKNSANNIKIKNRFIKETWLKSYDGNKKRYIAALFELEFPSLEKRIYIMVGSGCLRIFETHGDDEMVGFFSNISSHHGGGDIPIVTIALGQRHMYIQDSGKVLPLSLFNRSLQYDKQSKDTYIDRMEADNFSWDQLQDLEGKLETLIESKKSKNMQSADYKALEALELHKDQSDKPNATRRKRCPNGTRRNSKTGDCETKTDADK